MPTSSKIYSIELTGLEGHLVEIEADKRAGLQSFVVVGLPDTAVKEARERVHSAIKNSSLDFPRGKTIVSLAPADLKKAGPRYDLPIAIGVISLFGILPKEDLKDTIMIGELALNGSIRAIQGVLSTVEFAQKQGFKKIILPSDNAAEANLIKGIKILPAKHLKEAVAYLKGNLSALPIHQKITKKKVETEINMQSIKGQAQAKRALEIAAAGGHNVLLNGPPGAGKTLMAKAMPGILPKMTQEETLEVTKIHSIAGLLPKSQPLVHTRPFRAIHHTASPVSIVGGGKIPAPGEITLAHHGVLFLDEIGEFPKTALEVLRQPMENQWVTISRAHGSVTYPAKFILVAAMNPCPCGYFNTHQSGKICTCTAHQIQTYQKRISGPLLDRIDIHLNIEPVKEYELMKDNLHESSEEIKKRVEQAVKIQQARFKKEIFQRNSEMNHKGIKKHCPLDAPCTMLMASAIKSMGLSARGYHKVIKLARTIADLENQEKIHTKHLAEALQYRKK